MLTVEDVGEAELLAESTSGGGESKEGRRDWFGAGESLVETGARAYAGRLLLRYELIIGKPARPQRAANVGRPSCKGGCPSSRLARAVVS